MPRDDASRKIESLMKESLHLPPPYGHDFSLPWCDSVFVYRVCVCLCVWWVQLKSSILDSQTR